MEYIALLPLAYAGYTDFKKREIPDWTWITIVILSIIINKRNIINNLIPAIMIFSVMLAIAYFVDGFGGGDIKLATALALLLGQPAYWVFLISTLLGLLSGIKIKKNIPFGTFLFIGSVIGLVVKLFI